MIEFLLSTFLMANPTCEKVVTESSTWPSLKQSINLRLEESSNLIHIASEADSILSKLIAAKSPVLLSWLDKRELMAAKEETIAKEWRKYYLHHFIFNRFPTKNSKVNSSVESLFSEINQLAFNGKEKARIDKIFEQVKTTAKQLLASWPLEAKSKTAAIHRVDTIKLYWFKKLEGTRYANKALEFIDWGFAYDPKYNEINVGVEARRYPTDANLFAIIAHEVGHSIDSCRWSSYFKTANPFQPILNCLRSKESVGALKRDDSKMKNAMESKLLSSDMALSLQQNPTCNRSFYPPEGVQKDQLMESFADWFSAEVFSQSVYKKEHPRPDLCFDKKLMTGSSYPSHSDRLQKIYLAHPHLKNLATHSFTAKYCSF